MEEHSHDVNPFENLDEETKNSIQELQIMEQNFQQLLMQKQAFSMEMNETDYTIQEIKKAEGDVFKIVGNQAVIKTSKDKFEKELSHKKDLIGMRLTSIEKQESDLSTKIESMRDKILKKISK